MANALDNCTRVPLASLIQPRDGWVCHLNSWWTITERGEVLFFRGLSAQCNDSEATARHLQKRLYPGLDVRLVPVAYLPNRDAWESDRPFKDAIAKLASELPAQVHGSEVKP